MPSYEIVQWKCIKNIIKNLNPLLYRAIETIPNVDAFELIRAKYNFGDYLVKNGIFHIRAKKGCLPVSDDYFPLELKSLLDYNWAAIPLGILTQNTVEAFVNHDSHIMPFRLLQPGKVFSILSVFEPKTGSHSVASVRSMTAGARSLVFLPKISQKASLERLNKRFNFLGSAQLKDRASQWKIFREICNEPHENQPWQTEIFLFGKAFLAENQDTQGFHYFLLKSIWMQDSFRRHEGVYDLIISSLLKRMPDSLKNEHDVLHHLKQLLMIALREYPGFVPSFNDLPGPIRTISQVMLDVYKLRFHYPIFMNLAHYSGKLPVYYSLQHPTYFYEIPRLKRPTQFTIVKMQKLKELMKNLRKFVLENCFVYGLENTLLYDILKNTEFSFCHPRESSSDNLNVQSLIEQDKRFSIAAAYINSKKPLEFPYGSNFFYGCVRISPSGQYSHAWDELSQFY